MSEDEENHQRLINSIPSRKLSESEKQSLYIHELHSKIFVLQNQLFEAQQMFLKIQNIFLDYKITTTPPGGPADERRRE